jgi:hypothetical protein
MYQANTAVLQWVMMITMAVYFGELEHSKHDLLPVVLLILSENVGLHMIFCSLICFTHFVCLACTELVLSRICLQSVIISDHHALITIHLRM